MSGPSPVRPTDYAATTPDVLIEVRDAIEHGRAGTFAQLSALMAQTPHRNAGMRAAA